MNTILEQDIELFAQQFALKDELRKKTIAITGATGLLGACMVRCLLKLNSQQNLGLRILAVVYCAFCQSYSFKILCRISCRNNGYCV